ncbi:hypothetical protein [Marinobacter salarius]|uniref:hypothetical protein n=3 Tax=Marinobacter salarius TaxID=1420917 RepID=UPI0010AA0AD1|nr:MULTISPECIES: hypothetical protein [Marinobacter]HIO30778.1 hypothetical protein [Marinobacter salarius]HIP01723.1 hypothetical protein [Marinobacter salarius]
MSDNSGAAIRRIANNHINAQHNSAVGIYGMDRLIAFAQDVLQAAREQGQAQSQGVPEVATDKMLDEGVQALIRGLKSFPGNYTQVVSNIWEDMAAARSTPAAPQADEIEPDLLWDYDNGEDSGQDSAYELADYCAQDLPHGETMEVVVMCAKRLPNRHMKIWVDEDDDVQWEWISPQSPEQGDGV